MKRKSSKKQKQKDTLFYPEKIVSVRQSVGGYEYKIKWRGYGFEECSWETPDRMYPDVADPEASPTWRVLVSEYEHHHPKKDIPKQAPPLAPQLEDLSPAATEQKDLPEKAKSPRKKSIGNSNYLKQARDTHGRFLKLENSVSRKRKSAKKKRQARQQASAPQPIPDEISTMDDGNDKNSLSQVHQNNDMSQATSDSVMEPVPETDPDNEMKLDQPAIDQTTEFEVKERCFSPHMIENPKVQLVVDTVASVHMDSTASPLLPPDRANAQQVLVPYGADGDSSSTASTPRVLRQSDDFAYVTEPNEERRFESPLPNHSLEPPAGSTEPSSMVNEEAEAIVQPHGNMSSSTAQALEHEDGAITYQQDQQQGLPSDSSIASTDANPILLPESSHIQSETQPAQQQESPPAAVEPGRPASADSDSHKVDDSSSTSHSNRRKRRALTLPSPSTQASTSPVIRGLRHLAPKASDDLVTKETSSSHSHVTSLKKSEISGSMGVSPQEGWQTTAAAQSGGSQTHSPHLAVGHARPSREDPYVDVRQPDRPVHKPSNILPIPVAEYMPNGRKWNDRSYGTQLPPRDRDVHSYYRASDFPDEYKGRSPHPEVPVHMYRQPQPHPHDQYVYDHRRESVPHPYPYPPPYDSMSRYSVQSTSRDELRMPYSRPSLPSERVADGDGRLHEYSPGHHRPSIPVATDRIYNEGGLADPRSSRSSYGGPPLQHPRSPGHHPAGPYSRRVSDYGMAPFPHLQQQPNSSKRGHGVPLDRPAVWVGPPGRSPRPLHVDNPPMGLYDTYAVGSQRGAYAGRTVVPRRSESGPLDNSAR